MAVPQESQIDRQVNQNPDELNQSVQLRLNAYLRNCSWIAGQAINCEFFEGILVLRGHVDSFYQKQMAQELARRVHGVEMVINRLTVDPSRNNGLDSRLNSSHESRQVLSHH